MSILRKPGQWPSTKSHLLDTLAVLSLGLAILGTYWRIAAGVAYFPAAGGDLASFLYPTYRLAADALQHGAFPLWNPWLYSGAPHIADIQAGFVYPPNLLLFLIWPHFSYTAMEWLSLLHLWWAGAGLYLFARHLHSRRSAAWLAALAWLLSDFFIIHLGNLNLVAVMAWLPWLLWLYDIGVQKAQCRWAIGNGFLLALAILAGHPQALLFLLLSLLLMAILSTSEMWQSTKDWRPKVRPWAHLLLTVFLGSALAAPVLIPAWRIIPFTDRAHFSYWQAVDYSLHPLQWIGLVLPGFFQQRQPAMSWGPWPRVEVGYLGLITLCLAATGLRWPNGDASAARRRHLGLLFTLVGFGLSLGGEAVWQGWLYWLVPGFDHLRAPARFIVLGDFGLALLAINGVQWLLSSWRETEKRRFLHWRHTMTVALAGALALLLPLFYFALLTGQDKDPVIFRRIAAATNSVAWAALITGLWLALLWLRPPRPRRWFTAALLILLFFELSAQANVDMGPHNPTTSFDHPALVAFFHNDAALFRIDSDHGINNYWAPDTAALHRLQDIGGIYNPLTLTAYRRFRTLAKPGSALYNFLNVKYLLLRKTDTAPAGFVPVNQNDPQLTVYLNRAKLPRMQLIYRVRVAPDEKRVWDALADPTFDPQKEVVLVRVPARPLGGPAGSHLQLIGYSAQQVSVAVTLDSPAYLVISDVWYPGWQALLDSREVPLLRANGAFRAVYLPAGKHHLVMTFRPAGWTYGWLLFSTAVLSCLLFFGWRRFSPFATRR